jgi:hypothetical protein
MISNTGGQVFGTGAAATMFFTRLQVLDRDY